VFPIYLSVGAGTLGSKRIFVGIVHDITGRKTAEDACSGCRTS